MIDQTLGYLDRLVSFDTVSARSNLIAIDWIQEFLTVRGFAVTRVTAPCGNKAGLFASIGPEGDGVLLSAHTDVVPVEGQDWSYDPFVLTRSGECLYGRGTTDMKGFLAVMLTAADMAADAQLKEPLKLSISYDEEVGCIGIAHMLGAASVLGQPRAAIIGEPTEMQVAIGHKGKAAFRAVARGEAGHSSLAPNFPNALHAAADFMQGLRDMQVTLEKRGARDAAYAIPYSTVHVGRLSGGKTLNIVPDHAELEFEIRYLPDDSLDALQQKIKALAHELGITVTQINAYPGLDTLPDDPIVSWGRAMSRTNHITKMPYGTEAGYFAAHGIPAIVCGPGSMQAQGHKPDEFIHIDQLRQCGQMLQRVVHDLC